MASGLFYEAGAKEFFGGDLHLETGRGMLI
jgi:hypothetical protein